MGLHISTDLANLSLHAPYDGGDDVVISDGKGLCISHIGSLKFPNISLNFYDALHVSVISRNLISVSRLCHDNNMDVLFSEYEFQVVDRRTGDTRLRRPRVNGLYL